ncbi:MAG: hypothetical protein C4325_01265 [Blastocatellia bacterium]
MKNFHFIENVILDSDNRQTMVQRLFLCVEELFHFGQGDDAIRRAVCLGRHEISSARASTVFLTISV